MKVRDSAVMFTARKLGKSTEMHMSVERELMV